MADNDNTSLPQVTDDHDLPDHTLSMRSAARHCLELFQKLPDVMPALDVAEKNETEQGMLLERQQAYEEFWSRESPTMEIVDASEFSSPRDFRKGFHDRNLPCLINGLESYFERANKAWRGPHNTINREWFAKNLGEETLVPLRYQPQQKDKLDEDGRASECQTKQVPMKEWIGVLQEGDESTDEKKNPYYLKDWHLLLQLEQEQSRSIPKLYTCPEIFQFDLFNSFLTKFTKGDYRFCYWGPKASSTVRHSDVLHSFSWSYNVVGSKEWTFYKDHQQFTIVQTAGQAVFVPCTWQHQVVNLEETISINHNWITTANIDQTWGCLKTEMKAIEKELKEWGVDDNIESCESMLRGCVGLDVTAFFFMVLSRLLKLLLSFEPTEEDWSERSFDIYRLTRSIRCLLDADYIQLKGRLGAVLQSKDLAMESYMVAMIVAIR
jgi:hypothetical protein